MDVTFHQLEAACRANNMSVSLFQFDCGETVTVTNGVGQLFRVTKECGEDDAVDVAATWLITHTFIKLSDIPPRTPDLD